MVPSAGWVTNEGSHVGARTRRDQMSASGQSRRFESVGDQSGSALKPDLSLRRSERDGRCEHRQSFALAVMLSLGVGPVSGSCMDKQPKRPMNLVEGRVSQLEPRMRYRRSEA